MFAGQQVGGWQEMLAGSLALLCVSRRAHRQIIATDTHVRTHSRTRAHKHVHIHTDVNIKQVDHDSMHYTATPSQYI